MIAIRRRRSKQTYCRLFTRCSQVVARRENWSGPRFNHAAREAGWHVHVAVAPTYPECDEADLCATLKAVAELEPLTIFHEPINILAENVARIEEQARSLGVRLKTEVFATRES